MKKFAEQLKKKSEMIRLRSDERNELRERVLAYMEYHPMPAGQQKEVRSLVRNQKKAPSFLNVWFVGRLVGATAVLFLVIVPALAENALPGEALYPVKVRFNEELRGALASTPYQKVEWETERLERRLAEAQLLAVAGKLTPDAEAEVALAIKQHSQAAKDNIDVIRESDNEEAAIAEITFSSALEVSAELLTKREHNSGTSSASTLSGAVSEARASVVTSDGSLSYQKLLYRLEAETTRAQEYLNTLNSVTTDAEKLDISRRLTDVKVKVETAAQMKGTDEASAAKILAEALGNTRKLISFMTNIDVRKNVTVEELVPIVPTTEEKQTLLERKLGDASSIVVSVTTASRKLATSSNDYIAIVDTVTQYRELETTSKASLKAGDLNTAEVSIGLALELAQALKSTLTGLGISLQTASSSTSASSTVKN